MTIQIFFYTVHINNSSDHNERGLALMLSYKVTIV